MTVKGVTLGYDTETLLVSVEAGGALWKTCRPPSLLLSRQKDEPEKEVLLTRASTVATRPWKTGLGEGFLTHFEGIPGTTLSFDTLLWIDNCRGDLFAELIPYGDPKDEWERLFFPAAFEFGERRSDWRTVLNMVQGLLLENDKTYGGEGVTYHQYGSRSAYMPWFGQYNDANGWICIGVTEYDGGYRLDSRDDGTKLVSPCWIPSLGRAAYRRVARYTFFKGDYNTMAALYRHYARETGRLVTLKEKAVRCPNVGKLPGCAWVHESGYVNISPDSHYYNKEHPEENRKVYATFDQRAAQMRALKEKWGLSDLYFHLDGWGIDGYDSHHPDYLPPNEKLGGWEGMKRLSDTMKELGYLFATHDQYRDYYFNAESFDREMAVHDTKGNIQEYAIWLGGKQSVLCSSQAPLYVRRNYSALAEHGIDIAGTYQDVFSVVELDECDHPWHRVTRKECAEFRKACFDYVMAHGIALSSEEAIDWSMQTLAFCHHAPFPKSPAPDFPIGIPVPLTHLVYHDCLIMPAYMGRGPSYNSDLVEGQNGLLLGLLTASPAYLPIEPREEDVKTARLAGRLNRAAQYSPMIHHEYLSPLVQRAVYECGITVTIDTERDTWDIQGL
jgi:hypothetical protein